MAEPKEERREHAPNRRRDRNNAQDKPAQRSDYAAGADGEQDIDASEAQADETARPDKDESVRPSKDGTGW